MCRFCVNRRFHFSGTNAQEYNLLSCIILFLKFWNFFKNTRFFIKFNFSKDCIKIFFIVITELLVPFLKLCTWSKCLSCLAWISALDKNTFSFIRICQIVFQHGWKCGCFPEWLEFPPAMYEWLFSILPAFGVTDVFYSSHSDGSVVVSHCSFNLHFPNG